MSIITLTLNPAYDIYYEVDGFKPFKENYVSSAFTKCGGKGINISKLFSALSVKHTAYAVLGKNNSGRFESFMEENFSDYKIFFTDGSIRENITIYSQGMKETRISADDFCITKELFLNLSNCLEKQLDKNSVLAFSGRLPKGIEKNDTVDYLCKLREKGVRLAVDCNSFTYADLIKIKPWFIKPNEEEICDLGGKGSLKEALSAAKKLHENGIENVMVSLGERGGVFVGEGVCVRIKAADITPVSEVGAGDSTVAGFIAAFMRTIKLKECVRFAAACGSAACLKSAASMPDIYDIANMYSQTEVVDCGGEK